MEGSRRLKATVETCDEEHLLIEYISERKEDKNAFYELECSSNWSNLQKFLGIQDPSFFPGLKVTLGTV